MLKGRGTSAPVSAKMKIFLRLPYVEDVDEHKEESDQHCHPTRDNLNITPGSNQITTVDTFPGPTTHEPFRLANTIQG